MEVEPQQQLFSILHTLGSQLYIFGVDVDESFEVFDDGDVEAVLKVQTVLQSLQFY